MSTRAKFKVNSVKHLRVGDRTDSIEVNLGAVYGSSGENAAFWKATPSGQINLFISNPDAFDAFESGKEYYVDFTPAGGTA